MIIVDTVSVRGYHVLHAVKGCHRECGHEWKVPPRAKEPLNMTRRLSRGLRVLVVILAAGVICGLAACV